MIIKSIQLKNIRSYEEAVIDFPQGTTLFEGDAGSGKSTILMGIEFALFGLGAQNGDSLIRKTESEGFVSLIFEANGNEYMVRRTVKRSKGGGVEQGPAYIRDPDGRILTARPTEMKAEILKILNFNESPNPRTESKIYRYAIFTPQEEMKTILDSPEIRLQTLRKALDIEQYKIAKDNALLLIKKVNSRIKTLEFAAADVEEKRSARKKIVSEISDCTQRLQQKQQDRDKVLQTLDALSAQLDSFRAKKEELIKLQAKIPELQKQLNKLRDDIPQIEKKCKKDIIELKELESTIRIKQDIEKPTDLNEQELRVALQLLEENHGRLTKTFTEIDAKLDGYRTILNDGFCPMCERNIDPSDFREKVATEESRKSDAAVAVDRSARDVNAAKGTIEALLHFNNEQNQIELLQQNARFCASAVQSASEKIAENQNQILNFENELKEARKEIERLETVSETLTSLEKSKEDSNSEFTRLERDISKFQATIDLKMARRKELDDEIEKREDMLRTSKSLQEYQIWLKDYFAETVANIERVVLTSLQQVFDQFFQKWFGTLIEDPTKFVRIDESFTPIVKQNGHEQAVKNLSGGETTSIALAYRLALNMTVRKASAILQSDLLILDEPTYGFSKELLVKVGDVLSELGCPQVILVSHEKELERFADQVFRVTKVDGVSAIS